jgi:2-haloacid dehalogenase
MNSRTAAATLARPHGSAGAPVQAVLFDAYGTLFDVHSVAHLGEQLFPGQGEALSQLWRDKQIEYTRLLTMSAPGGNRYRPFWEVTQSALRYALRRLGLRPADEAAATALEARLMNQYRALTAFPEVREVLAGLRAAGLVTGILSNGDPAMLDIAVRSAGIEPLLNHLISVEPVKAFKTDPRAYALGPQHLGLSASQILFVSANGWDAIGATWFGFRTLWVNRGGLPMDELGTAPTHTGSSLRDALALVTA